MNAIASLSIGRDYLTKDTSLVENIFIRIVLKEPRYDLLFDTATEEMAIATLQKLSLRNNQRLYMISAGILSFFSKILHNPISSFVSSCKIECKKNINCE